MPKELQPLVEAALSASTIEPFIAVDLDFDSASLYIWSGDYNLTIGSKTYLGTGQLLEVSGVEETSEIQAVGASVTMTGIPSEYITLALTEPYQGRPCRIYFGIVSSPSDYVEIFSGEMDQMNIDEGGTFATITVTMESDLIKLERPVVRRFTHEDQKTRYPSDKGLIFVADLQDKEIYWGRRTPKNND